jgi:hypothetical protein
MASNTTHLDVIVSQLNSVANDLENSPELEEITDVLIDLLLDRLPFPKWLPFAKGFVRKRLDAFLPGGLFKAVREAIQAVKARKSMVAPS